MEKIPQRAPGELVSAAAVVDARRAVKARHIVTVSRAAADAYAVARKWVAKIPDYEIVNEVENEIVAWKTVGGSPLRHAGSVNLRENADGGTEVRIEIDYEPSDVAFGMLFDDLTKELLAKR
jgi:hypothetical protein